MSGAHKPRWRAWPLPGHAWDIALLQWCVLNARHTSGHMLPANHPSPDLVEPALCDHLPPDLSTLLALLPRKTTSGAPATPG
jgi:hypothetical protein